MRTRRRDENKEGWEQEGGMRTRRRDENKKEGWEQGGGMTSYILDDGWGMSSTVLWYG